MTSMHSAAAAANGGARLEGAALAYAARGWPVFPLKPQDKAPLIPKSRGGNGVHDATTDPDRIRAWWAAEPRANIGLAAGAAFWVLDVDYAGWEATEPDGATSLAALVARFGRLPATMTQLTGGGGWQLFFRADARVKNGVRSLPGIDVRAAGGYVVAPPSIHPDTQRPYRWRRGAGEVEIAAAPEWLLRLVEPVVMPMPTPPRTNLATLGAGRLGRYAAAALAHASEAIQGATPGEQEVTLNRESYGIGRLVAGGVIPKGEAFTALVAAGCGMRNAPGRPAWTHREIAYRVERALRQAEQQPRALEAC